MAHSKKTGFTSFEAARNDLKAQGFSAPGPYSKTWTHTDGTVFAIGGSIKGAAGQSARGRGWVFGYYPV